jgi:hypothetical protein
MGRELARLRTAFYEMEGHCLFDRQSDGGTLYWDIVPYFAFVGLQREMRWAFRIPESAVRRCENGAGHGARDVALT